MTGLSGGTISDVVVVGATVVVVVGDVVVGVGAGDVVPEPSTGAVTSAGVSAGAVVVVAGAVVVVAGAVVVVGLETVPFFMKTTVT